MVPSTCKQGLYFFFCCCVALARGLAHVLFSIEHQPYVLPYVLSADVAATVDTVHRAVGADPEQVTCTCVLFRQAHQPYVLSADVAATVHTVHRAVGADTDQVSCTRVVHH